MTSPAYLLRRVMRASYHELSERARQLRFRLWNQLHAKAGRPLFPIREYRRAWTARELIENGWGQRPRRLLPPDSADRMRAYYAQLGPSEQRALLRRGDELVAGRMTIFSRKGLPFRGPDRWHRDPILGITSPRQFYGSINYLDVQEVGDSKHVWEANRCGWIYPLAIAHHVTGKARYADTFREWTGDWLSCNPYPVGINFCSSLEIAIRTYAWLWSLDLFAHDLSRDPHLVDQILYGIWTGCRHIEANLSYYFAPNTHILGEAFALFACGTLLPEFRDAERWQALGEEILVDQASRQIHRDGTHRELSMCYHLYTTEFYLHAVMLARQAGSAAHPALADAARALAARLDQLTPPDGILPQLNDSDGGRLTWFADQSLDARPALHLARSLWPDQFRVDWPMCMGDHIWIGTPAAAKVHDGGPSGIGRPETDLDSGIAVHKNRHGDYLLFRCGPFGYLDAPHSHDGQLGLTVYLAGIPFIVDCGTGAYTQDIERRNQFRLAAGKNAPLVNGTGPSQPDQFFSWQRVTTGGLEIAPAGQDPFYARGSHEGFTTPLGFAVRVSRAVTLPAPGVVAVCDRWEADHPITLQQTWTLAPSWQIGADGMLRHDPMAGSDLCTEVYIYSYEHFPMNAGRVVPWLLERGPYSPDYGHECQTHVVTYRSQASCQGTLVTLMSRAGQIEGEDVPNQFLWDRLPACHVWDRLPACHEFRISGERESLRLRLDSTGRGWAEYPSRPDSAMTTVRQSSSRELLS